MSTIQNFAKSIWEHLESAYPEYAVASRELTNLISELRHCKIDAKPRRVHTIRLRSTIEDIVERLVGKSLGVTGMVTVPICNISIKISQVFAISEDSTHILHDACKAFLEEHNLALKPLRSGRSVTYMVSRNV